ncbi:hypothetical protein D9M71_380610 [compost metagenome]
MQVGEQRVFLLVFETQFFREDQGAAGQQRLTDARQQCRALVRGDELQGEVQRHHRGRLELQGEDVAFDHLHRQQLLEHRVLTVEVLAAAFDHRRRVIHSDDAATIGAHVAAQGLGHGTQRRAQVVEHAARLGELRGEHAEVFDDGRITRHRALDHVREHPHHVLVEGEVRHLGQRLGEKAIGFFAHGGSSGVGGKGRHFSQVGAGMRGLSDKPPSSLQSLCVQ